MEKFTKFKTKGNRTISLSLQINYLLSLPPLQARNQTSSFFCWFWTQIRESCQLKFVKLFPHQKWSDWGNRVSVSELSESLSVVEGLHEHLWQFLLVLCLFILLFPKIRRYKLICIFVHERINKKKLQLGSNEWFYSIYSIFIYNDLTIKCS